jgi:hypothetical protein
MSMESFMKAMLRLLFIAVFCALAGCANDSDSLGISIFSQNFDFSQEQHGWQHGFAQYPAGPDDSVYYELKYAYQSEPGGSKSIMLSGNNRSTELFMYLKRKLEGLSPNTVYTLTFNVSLFADAQQVSTVAAGESVFLKVGATGIEPKSLIDRDRFIMNIDKGDLNESGDDMISIGDLSTPAGTYTQITRTNSSNTNSPFEVKSNSRGEIWLIVGTDSGASGKTTLYYSKIYLTLSSAN